VSLIVPLVEGSRRDGKQQRTRGRWLPDIPTVAQVPHVYTQTWTCLSRSTSLLTGMRLRSTTGSALQLRHEQQPCLYGTVSHICVLAWPPGLCRYAAIHLLLHDRQTGSRSLINSYVNSTRLCHIGTGGFRVFGLVSIESQSLMALIHEVPSNVTSPGGHPPPAAQAHAAVCMTIDSTKCHNLQ
jgi:hypothetical protein